MTLHYVRLSLGGKTYKEKVSTQGCSDVADFKDAIKNKFPHLLDAYDAAQLTLFESDGTTEIDPETSVAGLKETPWKPMVVKVEEPPAPLRTGSSKKQLSYKRMSTEASCRKYFDALAAKLALFYKFDWGADSSFPTIGDVFKAVEQKTWKYQKRQKTLAERTSEAGYIEPATKVPKLAIPLPELFDQSEWKRIKELNRKTTDRIHDANLPKENGKFFIILPTAEFNDETVRLFKRVGVKGKLFTAEEDMIWL